MSEAGFNGAGRYHPASSSPPLVEYQLGPHVIMLHDRCISLRQDAEGFFHLKVVYYRWGDSTMELKWDCEADIRKEIEREITLCFEGKVKDLIQGAKEARAG